LVGPSDVKLARQRLGMTRVQFGTAMGIGGNYNTINKAVYELETNEMKELPLHKKEQLFGLLTAHELKLGKNLDGHTHAGGGYNPDTGRTDMPEFAISITDHQFPG